MRHAHKTLVLLLPLLGCSSPKPPAPLPAAEVKLEPTVPQVWQMLDYLATDYAGAVGDGEVIDAAEYEEMTEFADMSRRGIRALAVTPAKPQLQTQADALVAAIAAKASPESVSTQAHALADALLLAHPMPQSPQNVPVLAVGATLYQATCASCHGVDGAGDGPAGATLEPPPVNFRDLARADERSPLSLYEVIRQGVKGTAMPGYEQLSADERWSLAYYVGSLAYESNAKAGAKQWKHNFPAQGMIANLKDLSRARVAALAPTLGLQPAREIVGYLRAHPTDAQDATIGIALVRARLAASVSAYENGDIPRASKLALSAYLDGFEPVEARLDSYDHALRKQIEGLMGAYRTALADGAAVDVVSADVKAIGALLARAEAGLHGG